MKNRTLPPTGWFRAFESSARLLSFTAAADELGLTQSAVSQQIKSLEVRFGCALFVRKHRGISLTDEGRRLFPLVAEGIGNLKAAAAAFEPAADPGLLTIATSVSIAQWFLVPRLKLFTEQNRDIRVRIVTTVWPDEFVASSADVQIQFGPIESADKLSAPLGNNQLALVASPSLFESAGKPSSAFTLSSLSDYSLIQTVGTSDTWQKFAESTGESLQDPATLLVDSHGMSVDFARAGFGVALTSTLISSPCIITGSLIQIHPTVMTARDGYFINTRKGNNTAIAEEFSSWIKNEARESEAAFFA